MSIVVTCQCGRRFAAQPHLAGKRVRCPACGGVIAVPQTGSASAVASGQPQMRVVACPCGRRLQLSAQLAGRQARCPACGRVFVVPSGSSATMARKPAQQPSQPVDPFWDEVLAEPQSVQLAQPNWQSFQQNPYQAPSFAGQAPGPAAGNRRHLRSIAVCQKGILVCILIYLLAVILQFAVPPSLRVLMALPVLGAGIVGTVFVFLLAMRIYHPALGVLLGILTLVPCLGLIMLLIVNGKATAVLKQHGLAVGLMGADLSRI